MGEAQGRVFEPTFNRAAKIESSDCRLTSDAGALVLRGFDHRLQLSAAQFHDPRDPQKIRYEIVTLLRERLCCQALGYTAQDDVDRLVVATVSESGLFRTFGDWPKGTSGA